MRTQEQAPNLNPTDDQIQAAYQAAMHERREVGALDMYVAAAGLPEGADGPAVTKAGLGHEKVMAAGFSGYQELRDESKDWVAKADARDRVSDDELNAESRLQARAEGVQREADYQAEMKTMRSERDANKAAAEAKYATDRRAAIIEAHQDRIDGIVYSAKIKGGGQNAFDKNPEAAAKIKQEATERVVAEVEAEGFDFKRGDERHYKVTRNLAGEARSAEMAELLSDFRKGKLVQHETAEQRAEKTSFDQLKQDVEADFPNSENDKDFDAHADEALKLVAYAEPITDPSEKGMRSRTKRIMAKAAAALKGLRMVEHPEYSSKRPSDAKKSGKRSVSAFIATKYTMGTQRVGEYFGDEEKGTRRKVGAVVVGAIAVGTIAFLSYKGLQSGSSNGGAQEAANNGPSGGSGAANHPGTGGNHGGSGAGNHHGGGSHTPNHQPAHTTPAHHNVAKLKPGENPWTAARADLVQHGNLHPTDAQIQVNDARILHVNHISPEQAHHLAVGTELDLDD